jgi:hypothetical protein
MNATPSKGPLFFIVGRPGQLGNQLYFFSYVISLAIKLGGRVANPGFFEYAPSFAATEKDPFSRWPLPSRSESPPAQSTGLQPCVGGGDGCGLKGRPQIPAVFERRSALRARWLSRAAYEIALCAVRVARKLRLPIPGVKIIGIHEAHTSDYVLTHQPFLDSIRDARVVFIGGWLELSQIRFEHPEKIREFFSLAERHRLAVDKVTAGARAACDVLIGVHIRQGDYASFQGGRFNFPTRLYEKNMRLATPLFPGKKVGFIVCSNLPQTITDPMLSVVRPGPGQPVEDLYALAACDYIIAPPSTFSRWASFYGQTPLWEMRDEQSSPKLEEFEIRS